MASTLDAPDNTPTTAQLPMTPERGRTRSRYPSHLTRELDAEGNPRPLMHRRGTSRTYETLEDLLKEAGYKETRVFTPEMERREAEREEQKERAARREAEHSGVSGAVVKLFSTWMNAGSRRVARIDASDDDEESHNVKVPSSPLAHRSKHGSTLRPPSPPRSSTSSTLTVRPRGPSLSLLQQQHSLTRPSLTASSTSTIRHPPSRARIALRHAASAPHIDKQRRRTQQRPPRPKVPPLPPTWLESISAALLSPRLVPSPPVSPSSIPRKPSIILTQRAHTSVGPVTVTNVVCRSSPSSRASSPPRILVSALVPAEDRWPPHSPHHLPHTGPIPEFEDDDLDGDDDELDLTTMLIPAKRQHSIRSLRSVLLQQHQNSLPSVARAEYARMMRRRIEERDAEGHWDSGEFLVARAVKRRRSNLPRTWGWTSS